MLPADPARIRSAWQGRISGCLLGKPVELLSMREGHDALSEYLVDAAASPLRDYVPALGERIPEARANACKGRFDRAVWDDDINYSVLALMLLERHGRELESADVGRAWLTLLPGGTTFTAERAAYQIMLQHAGNGFPFGAEPGFDLSLCSDNPYNDWIGAQIRADLYGWVCPGEPDLAADLASRDASLSHRGNGIYGAAFVAALGAAIPAETTLDAAIDAALTTIPADSRCADAVALGRELTGAPDAVALLHARYDDLSPVHTVNNLALVVWALTTGWDDFSQAIGDAVAAGWDTDCNGATVGGLWGLQGHAIPEHWTRPWQGRVAVTLAGMDELPLDELVERTVRVAESFT